MVPGLEVVFYYSWFVIFWFLDMSHMHGRVSKARTMRGGPWSGGGVLIFMPVSARGTEQGGSLPLSPSLVFLSTFLASINCFTWFIFYFSEGGPPLLPL